MFFFVLTRTLQIVLETRRRGKFGETVIYVILPLFFVFCYFGDTTVHLSFGNYVLLFALLLFVVYSLPCGKQQEVNQEKVNEGIEALKTNCCFKFTQYACVISDALYNIYVVDPLTKFLPSKEEVNKFLALPAPSHEELDGNVMWKRKFVLGLLVGFFYASASSGKNGVDGSFLDHVLPILITVMVVNLHTVTKCIEAIWSWIKSFGIIKWFLDKLVGWLTLAWFWLALIACLYSPPSWSLKVILVALLISVCCLYYHFQDVKAMEDLLRVMLGAFFLFSYLMFFFLIFLTFGALFANSIATILFGFEDDSNFVTGMKFAVLSAIFTMLFLLPKAVYYVFQRFDSSGEELKRELDNYYEIIPCLCKCKKCNFSQESSEHSGAGASRSMGDDDPILNNDTNQAYDKVSDAIKGLQGELEGKDLLEQQCIKIGEELESLKKEIVKREKECDIDCSPAAKKIVKREKECDIDCSPAAKKRFSYLCGIMINLFALMAVLITNRENGRQVEPSPTELQNKDRTLYFQGLFLHRDLHITDIRSKLQSDDTHTYSACQMRWGDLSALDHAILASVAYYQPEILRQDLESLKTALEFIFPKTLGSPETRGYNVTLVEDWATNEQRKNHTRAGKFNKYYRLDFNDRKHTVIAVQGTDATDPMDVFTDLRLWFVSALMDFATWIIFPFNFLLPHQRGDIQWLIDSIHEHITINERQVGGGKPCVGISCLADRRLGRDGV